MRILGIPLGWILHFCYSLVQNYGLALVMFTVLTRLILLPLSIGSLGIWFAAPSGWVLGLIPSVFYLSRWFRRHGKEGA